MGRFAAVAQLGALCFAVLLTVLVAGAFRSATAAAPPPRELVALRTQNSRTFANADGTRSVQLSALPMNFRDDAGRWQTIDDSLVRTTTRTDYAWRNGANAFRVLFKDQLGANYMRFAVAERSFDISLDGVAAKSITAAGNHARYAGAFAGVDLAYSVTPDGVKETLQIAKATAPNHYRFTITAADGGPLAAKKVPGNLWIFTAPGGPNPLFVLRPPVAYDAAGRGGGRVASMNVRSVADGFSIDLTLSKTWLTAPERRFPIALDPTITLQPPAMVWNYDISCGSCSWEGAPLWNGASDYDPDFTGTYAIWRTVARFDLSALPANAQVTAATFGLWDEAGSCISITGQTCGQNSHTLEVHRLTAPFDWATTPSQLQFDPTVLSTFTLPAAAPSQWMTWDVKSTVQGWANGTFANDGFLIKRDTEPKGSGGPGSPDDTAADPTQAPKLTITYIGDAVALDPPATLHSNGADLSWSKWDGSTAEAFGGYEIHRSTDAGFTPSADNLVATIGDPSITTYRDTTAAPQKTYTYKVSVNGFSSTGQTVTLPADGQASKALVLTPQNSKMSYLSYESDKTVCSTYGKATQLFVGTDKMASGKTSITSIYRPLVWFDVRDIPAGATITSAQLKLYAEDMPAGVSTVTTEAHRVTAGWDSGSSDAGSCTGDGTTWYDRTTGVKWKSPGGDFDPTVVSSVTHPTTDGNGWDTFNVASAVQQWVNGTAPNLGLLFKFSSETAATGNWYVYDSNYDGKFATLRPQLTLTYADSSHSQAPSVAIASPTATATGALGGSTTVTAAASDDGRVTSVDFYVDGQLAHTTTSAPYQFDWDTTGAANASHTLKAVATDDAGNQTTSSDVAVSVDNSQAPSASITAPAANATVSGSVAVSANAADDRSVSHVEFYVDGNRFVDTANAPYTATLATTGVDPIYDGSHTLTVKAYDDGGHVTTSAPVSITVANAPASSEYAATISSTEVPQSLTYDPSAQTQQQAGVDVTVTNTSSASWSGTNVGLRYRWISPDATPAYGDGAPIALSGTVAPGASQTLHVLLSPPALPDGVGRASYTLRFDLYDSAAGNWFAEKGNQPLDNPVVINKALVRNALGLERYYHYTGDDLGGGMQQLTNVANGNSIVRFTPFDEPGRGLATVVDLTYNALEQKCNCPAGNNWSLAVSSLGRLGEPLDIHPNKADQIAGNADKYVDLTDGDGTTHRFTDANNDGYWESPAGVHLYLRATGSSDPAKHWAFTRPDRVTFYYDQDGFPTSVVDGDGNALTLTESSIAAGDDPGPFKEHVTKITDAGGRDFVITYYTKADAKKPQIRGKIKSITDHLGRELDFDYYHDGNLLRLTEKGGTNADGSPLADRSWVFTYTTSDGSGPAIADLSARANPDPHTPNESTRLYSVRDPRGKESTFAYLGDGSGVNRWKLASYSDRGDNQTTFSYDEANLQTTVTQPLNRVWIYGYDNEGKVTKITNPLNQAATIDWSADREVAKVTEPTGVFTSYTYNDNGYLTSTTNQLGKKTVLTYQDLPVDANDVQSHWESGRTAPHLSQIATKQSPLGVAAGTGHLWTFTYDDNGNLTASTDPLNNKTTSTYNADGTLASVTDANSHTTSYGGYDANGLPETITDADGNVTRVGYDAAGETTWIEDPNHVAADPDTTKPADASRASYFYYDSFGRLGRQSTPKSTKDSPGLLIWTDASFDANDNPVAQQAPHFGTSDGMNGSLATAQYDDLDQQTLVTGPNKLADPSGERSKTSYDAAGRVVSVTSPNGVQSGVANAYTTKYDYDLLDRVTGATAYPSDGAAATARVSHYCYDLAGDLRSATSPNGNATFTACPAATASYTPLATAYTPTFAYDAAHRILSAKDPLGHSESVVYDADGQVTSATDANGVNSTMAYDDLGRVTKQTQTFDASGTTPRTATSLVQYDAVGNVRKEISPRAYDASGDKQTFTDYVTTYDYDPADRLVRTALPTDASTGALFQYQRYDANGQLVATSLPVATNMAATAIDWTQINSWNKTAVSYFDTGWIENQNNPGDPAVSYDYTAEGWQLSRTPNAVDAAGNDTGQLDTSKKILWNYTPDGQVANVTDPGGNGLSTYSYDADGNMTQATEGRGIQDPTAAPKIDATISYDGFGEQTKVSQKPSGATNSTVTTYQYDLDGNLTQLVDNAQQDSAGTQTAAGDTQIYTYDGAGWLQKELDQGTTPSTTSDDQTILWTYDAAQNPLTQTVQNASGSTKQQTTWSYFANGLLKSLKTTGTSSSTVLEQHTLGYVDSKGQFVDGNVVSDQFTLAGPTNTACKTTACTQTYGYDALDRLVSFNNGHGTTTAYTLDPAGDITKQVAGTSATSFGYTGTRLNTETDPDGSSYKFRYDANGNMDCVLKSAGTFASDCAYATGATPSANLIARYQYDPLNRLAATDTFKKAQTGSVADLSSAYVYDPLDRVASETEKHGTNAARTTAFSYLGLTSLEAQEKESGGATAITRTFSYDADGSRVGETYQAGTNAAQQYSYGYNAHGDVSLLVGSTGTATASYGYDAYGNSDAALSTGDSPTTNQGPMNPFRYTGFRLDSGSGTIDMGARRFGPDISHFLQEDSYNGALDDVRLATDPLTQNRYGLGGANPVSFVEVDGHWPVWGGGATGGNPCTYNPSPPPLDAAAIQAYVLNIKLAGVACKALLKTDDVFQAMSRQLDPAACQGVVECAFHSANVALLFGAPEWKGGELMAAKLGERVGPRTARSFARVYRALSVGQRGDEATRWRIVNVSRAVRTGTLVPKHFDLEVGGRTFSVVPNATKHLAEYARKGSFGGRFPLTPFAQAVRVASRRGLKKGRNFVHVGNWELGIDTRDDVIYHAVYRP